jgi:hypothetical protein
MQSETNLRYPSNSRKATTAGMLARKQGHPQDKAQPQQQKLQQQQDLCGKAIKVAGNEARNKAVNVTVIIKKLVAVKGLQVAVFLLGVAVKACRDLATLCL